MSERRLSWVFDHPTLSPRMFPPRKPIMKTLFACSLLFLSTALFAQNVVRSIATVGVAAIPYANDRALVPVSIEVKMSTAKEAEQDVDGAHEKVMQALKRTGVSKGDITVVGRSLRVAYEYALLSFREAGMVCQEQLQVRVEDLSRVDEVVKALATVANVEVGAPDYSSTKLGNTRREALLKAAEAAREKAELLAKSSGVKLKELLELEESGREWTTPESYSGGIASNFAGPSRPSAVGGNQVVTVTVKARYRIE